VSVCVVVLDCWAGAGAMSVLVPVVMELDDMFFGSVLTEADVVWEVTWVWLSAQPPRASKPIEASSTGIRIFMSAVYSPAPISKPNLPPAPASAHMGARGGGGQGLEWRGLQRRRRGRRVLWLAPLRAIFYGFSAIRFLKNLFSDVECRGTKHIFPQ